MKVDKSVLPILAGLIFVLPSAVMVWSQGASPSTASTTQANAVRTATLEVVVTDKSGLPVSGLDAKSFTLLDNKKPQSVTGFREVHAMNAASDPPVEAVLLIDNLSSGFAVLADLQRNLTEYLQKSGDRLPLPMSLVFLTDQGLKMQGKPTRDPKIMLANLESNPTVQQATQMSAGYDRWMEIRQKSLTALDVLAVDLNKRPGRKLVVWISPGWAAFEAETSQKTAKEREALFTFIVGISTLLRESGITLYAVDPRGANTRGSTGDSRYETQDYERSGNNQQYKDSIGGNNFKYKDYLKGVTSPKQADNGDLMLQVFAAQTGGNVLFGSNNTAQLIDRCLEDAQSYYELTFTLPNATQANEYHGLQVQIDKPGLKARSRMGYYAQP